MADNVSIKISELTRTHLIGEKDIIPFSTSLVTGTETTQAISLAALRMILANPTVYETVEASLVNSKKDDYVLVYADTTRTTANIYLNNGSSVNQLVDETGVAIAIRLPSSDTGSKFTFTAITGATLTIPAKLVGNTGFNRLMVINNTTPTVYGEYTIKKDDALTALVMSSALVVREGAPKQILVNWPANSSPTLTFNIPGDYSIRIY